MSNTGASRMRAKPFFKTRFAIRPGRDAGGDHWLGGTGNFRDAECPGCRKPLLLLLDINCQDPLLHKASRGKFGSLHRLPLFVCGHCFCELSYAVDESGKITVLQTRHASPGSEPYADYPNQFPRRAVALDATVPAALPRVIRKWNADADPCGDDLPKRDRRLLEEFFGHPIFIPRFLYHHQFGGDSLFAAWDDEAFRCPNKRCTGGILDRVLRRGRPMCFLAGILNDPPGGLPLIEPLTAETKSDWNYFVSFYFQICDRCLTVTTFSASD